MQITALHAPKAGNTEAEYEDAYRVTPAPEGDRLDGQGRRAAGVRVVVADGASESLLAGRWAGVLADAFAEAPEGAYDEPGPFARTAAEAADTWPDVVGAYIADRAERGSPLRWYERPGLARGAFATLLAVAVSAESGWRAAAVGDTCLFHVRDGVLCTAFPLQAAEDFGTAPPLLGSRAVDTGLVAARVRMVSGPLGPGDVLYGCTDALAAWILAADAPPWETLDGLDERGFATWLDSERTAGRMTNDDATLVRVAPR